MIPGCRGALSRDTFAGGGKPLSPAAERKRKSRARQSDEKRKEERAKNAERNRRSRARHSLIKRGKRKGRKTPSGKDGREHAGLMNRGKRKGKGEEQIGQTGILK